MFSVHTVVAGAWSDLASCSWRNGGIPIYRIFNDQQLVGDLIESSSNAISLRRVMQLRRARTESMNSKYNNGGMPTIG